MGVEGFDAEGEMAAEHRIQEGELEGGPELGAREGGERVEIEVVEGDTGNVLDASWCLGANVGLGVDSWKNLLLRGQCRGRSVR